MSKALPLIGIAAAVLAALSALIWWTAGLTGFADALGLVMFLLVIAGGIIMFFDRQPIAIGLGVASIILAVLAFIAFYSPWVGDNRDIIGPAPFALTYPVAGALGLAFGAFVFTVRREDWTEEWMGWTALAVSVVGIILFFVIQEPGVNSNQTGAYTVVPMLMALATAALHGLLLRES